MGGRARLIAALVAATTWGLVAAGPADAVSHDATSPTGTRSAAEIQVGSYNIRSDRTLAQFETAVDQFKPRVDVAGLQEIGMTAKNTYLKEDSSWGYYRPEQLQQNPVIWNTLVFDYVDAHGAKIANARFTGQEKPGDEDPYHPDSYATVVHLRHQVTGQLISIINVHLVSGAIQGGRAYPGRPRLFALYQEQVAGLTKVVAEEKRWGRVFVLGDFNAGYKYDRQWQLKRLAYSNLTGSGLTSMWQDYDVDHGTTFRGIRAYLDNVWSTEKAQQAAVETDIRQSDHFPVIASYRLSLLP